MIAIMSLSFFLILLLFQVILLLLLEEHLLLELGVHLLLRLLKMILILSLFLILLLLLVILFYGMRPVYSAINTKAGNSLFNLKIIDFRLIIFSISSLSMTTTTVALTCDGKEGTARQLSARDRGIFGCASEKRFKGKES